MLPWCMCMLSFGYCRLTLSSRRPDRASLALGLGIMLPSTPPCGRSLDHSVSLLGKLSTTPGACCSAARRHLVLPLHPSRTGPALCPAGGPALASHRQTCLRSCVVEVGLAVVTDAALAWLVSHGCTPALVPAESRPATGTHNSPAARWVGEGSRARPR